MFPSMQFQFRTRPLVALMLGLGVVTAAMPARHNDASGALLPLSKSQADSSGALMPIAAPTPAPAPAPVRAQAVATPVPAPASAPAPAPTSAPDKVAALTKAQQKAAATPSPAAAPAPNGQSRCNEEDTPVGHPGRDGGLLAVSDADPRAQLQQLVQMALEHSRTVGVAKLLTEAAEADVAESKAQQRLPQINLSGTAGHIGSIVSGIDEARGLQGSTTLSVSAPIYDFGRLAKLTEWRANLADAAKFSQSQSEEQIALQTVSLSLDRSRYILTAQVYKQYSRKMACLVDALQTITQADRGRSSELVQAQKSMQQADLSLEQTYSSLRQTEVRLRRFVGDSLPPSAGMSSVLAQVPDINAMQADILNASDINQATAQAKAQRSLAESVKAGQKPSVSLLVNATKAVGASSSVSWLGGVAVNIPLMQPGADASVNAANKRYYAADLQRDDAIEAKRYRLLEMNELATSSLDRAKRIVDILRNSDRVRVATLQQWQELGRRSLFDVMAAEGDYYSMRVAHVNSLFDAEQVVALIWSMGRGVVTPLR